MQFCLDAKYGLEVNCYFLPYIRYYSYKEPFTVVCVCE